MYLSLFFTSFRMYCKLINTLFKAGNLTMLTVPKKVLDNPLLSYVVYKEDGFVVKGTETLSEAIKEKKKMGWNAYGIAAFHNS